MKAKRKPANNGEAAAHREFTAGLRYALAKWWDYLEVGGNTYLLEQAFQEVLRCEAGQHPPDIIDTNRGERLAWEVEFDTLRKRFRRRIGLPSTLAEQILVKAESKNPEPTPVLPSQRPNKQQVEWENI